MLAADLETVALPQRGLHRRRLARRGAQGGLVLGDDADRGEGHAGQRAHCTCSVSAGVTLASTGLSDDGFSCPSSAAPIKPPLAGGGAMIT